jgi:hypothetical protein
MPGYAQTSPFAYVFVFFSCAKFRHVLAELKDEVSRGDTIKTTKQLKNGHPKLTKNQDCNPTNFTDYPIKTNM